MNTFRASHKHTGQAELLTFPQFESNGLTVIAVLLTETVAWDL